MGVKRKTVRWKVVSRKYMKKSCDIEGHDLGFVSLIQKIRIFNFVKGRLSEHGKTESEQCRGFDVEYHKRKK